VATVRIRGISSDTLKLARERARQLDLSLNDYVLTLIRRDLTRTKAREMWAQNMKRSLVRIPPGLVLEILREGREANE
jgi:hypothetical protein